MLLLDYEMAREDERVYVNIQSSLLSVAVALLAGLAALLASSCEFKVDQAKDCAPVPPLLLAATPLVPLALFSYLTLVGAVATVRSFYTRALESELQRVGASTLQGIPGLPPASLVTLTTHMVSLRRGRRGYRLLTLLIIVCNVALFGGFATYIVVLLPAPFALTAGVFYSACIMLLARETIVASVGGRSLFQSLVSAYLKDPNRNRLPPLTPLAEKERSVLGYLILPRPQDSVKWLFLPATFAIGVLSAGMPTPQQLRRALVVWLILEYLIYQARYQWNDIRGFISDQEHPARGDRRSLPGPVSKARPRFAASSAVLLCRLLAAGGLVLLLDELHLAAPVGFLTLSVFGVAVAYEALRAAEERAAPQPIDRVAPAAVALWTVVGAGYAIRGFTGLALAVDITKRPAIAVALVVALTAFGTAFVTITWTLEATVFGSWKYGRLIWPAQSAPGRQHILTLVRWLPDISDTLDTRDLRGHRVPQSGNNVTGWRALHDRRPLNAPYNLAILVAGAASTVLGRLLAGPADVASGLLAAMAGGAAALTVVVARYARILVMTAAVLGVGAVTQASNFPRPWLMNIPWVAIMGVYVIFTAQSWSTLKHPFADLLPVMRTFGMRLMRLFVGKASWDRLQQAAHETSR